MSYSLGGLTFYLILDGAIMFFSFFTSFLAPRKVRAPLKKISPTDMEIFRQITANNIALKDYPFLKELAMEAYLMENEDI